MLVVPLVLAGLAWFLLRTDAGVAVRAAAENADRALLLGIPIRRLSTIVWMIAGGLATLTFILKAPFAGVAPGLAGAGPPCSCCRRWPPPSSPAWSRCPIAFGAGIGLGIVESVVRWNTAGVADASERRLPRRDPRRPARCSGASSAGPRRRGTSSWSAAGVVKPIPERAAPPARGAVGARSGHRSSSSPLAFVFVPDRRGRASNQLPRRRSPSCGRWSACRSWSSPAGAATSASASSRIVGVGALVAGNLIADRNVDLFLALIAAGAGRRARRRSSSGCPALRIRGLFLAVTTLAFAVALDSYFLNPDNFPELDAAPTSARPVLLGAVRPRRRTTRCTSCASRSSACRSSPPSACARPAPAGSSSPPATTSGPPTPPRCRPTQREALGVPARRASSPASPAALHVMAARQRRPGPVPARRLSLDVFATAVIGGLGLDRRRDHRRAAVPVPRAPGRRSASCRLVRHRRRAARRPATSLPGGLGQLLFSVRDRYLRWVADRRGILVPSLVADKRVEDEAEDHADDEVDLLAGALSDAPARTPSR